MEANPKISVIMPSLNVRKYIETCMDSVTGQSLKELEIICVDAGSDDGTRELLESYSKKDSRVRVINSEKRSYGYQVNRGISEAKGEYLTILDTDDYLTKDAYEALYAVAVENPDADYIKGTVEYFYTLPHGEYTYVLKQLSDGLYINGQSVISPSKHPELLANDGFVWTGIYRSDYFKRFRMHESPGAAYQDLGMVLQLQMNGAKAVFIDKVCYHYRQDNMNASGYNPKGLSFVVNEYRWAKQFVLTAEDSWKYGFARKYFLQFLFLLQNMARIGEYNDDIYNYLCEIRDELNEYIRLGWFRPSDLWEDTLDDVLLLLGDPQRLYQKHRSRFNAQMKLIREAERKLEGKEVVLTSYGKIGRYMLDRLLFHGICKVNAIADNSYSIIGTKTRGIPIYSVEEAISLFPNATFLITNKNQYKELAAQLYYRNVSDDHIVICTETYQDLAMFAFR